MLLNSLRHARRPIYWVHSLYVQHSSSASASSSSPSSSIPSSSSPPSSSIPPSSSPPSSSPLSSSPPSSTLFDPHAKALQKARAVVAHDSAKYEYLRDHMANILIDRIEDISRSFPRGLDLFCGSAHFSRALNTANNPCGIQRLYHMDVHDAILSNAKKHFDGDISREHDAKLFDERRDIPIEPMSLDIVTSAGGLHWVNDLPGVLMKIRHSLKPDGVFVGAMLGGNTLQELRISMQLAEEEMCQRVAPRISPMVRLRDVAGLVSASGFTLPTADMERVIVSYANMHSLMQHLKGMGESNALFKREIHYGRSTFQRAAEIYQQRFGSVDDKGESRVPATFEIMHMIGWAPSAAQPTAKRRGSANASLTELSSATVAASISNERP